MNNKKVILLIGFLVSISLILFGCSKTKNTAGGSGDKYPEKNIKLISYLPEGAPPSQIAKKVAEIIEKEHGWHFVFESMPSNRGADAVNKVWNAPHDGYTVLGETENMFSLSTQGLTSQTAKDWVFYETFQEATVLVVKADSPYRTLDSLINAAKAKPGSIKIAHPDEGSSFDLKVKVLEKLSGAKVEHAPFIGAVGIVDALQQGQVDAVAAPMAVVYKEIGEAKLRPLVVLDAEPYNFGNAIGIIDSITKTYPDYGKYLPMDAIPGLALPADTPKEILKVFGEAFEEAMNSSEMEQYIKERGGIKVGLWGEGAKDYIDHMQSNYTWLSHDLGLTKVSPESLKIQKPAWK